GSSCPSRSQYDIRTRTGERRTLAWSHTVLRDAQGRPSGGAGIGLDITERMRAERAVRESEERFRELAEMLPEVVFETDAEGTLTFVNQRSHAITGYTREDFERGLSVFETVAPEDRDRARASVERVLRGESLGGNEYVIRRKDGSRFTAI